MGMTLDEAILHAEEVAEEKEKEGKLLCNSEAGSTGCLKCAEEHRQLAEWLKDYKRLKEQEPCNDAISRKQVKSDYADWFGYGYEDNWFYRHLSNVPPVNPQPKTGRWIRVTDKTGRFLAWECDKCGLQHKFATNFCPDCGAKKVESQESEE